MKEKQQTVKENESAAKTNSLPFEKELISLINKAMENGYSQNQTVTLLKQYWINNLPDLPSETEDEIVFREKLEKFMESKYKEFNSYSYKNYFKGQPWYWTKTDNLPTETKRKFIYEVCCTIYKGFKMETFDRNILKKINLQRTKIMFPEVNGHVLYYNLVLNQMLGYVYDYEVEEGKKEALEEYLSKYELKGKDDRDVAKFVWLVENFDWPKQGCALISASLFFCNIGNIVKTTNLWYNIAGIFKIKNKY